MSSTPDMTRLHVGGSEPKEGWKILNIQPGKAVDYVGDIQDLSQFANESWDEIYGSHVLEHVPQARVLPTLQGFHRILKASGRLMISVPDLDILCRLFIDPRMTTATRFQVMKFIFGAQIDATDFHHIGFNFEFLVEFLTAAGFSRIERVASFGIFNDYSSFAPYGVPISLNVEAFKK